MAGLETLIAVSAPTMLILGLRHGLDVDHISAIDSLVRLHNASRRSRWVGLGFSSGHILSILAELLIVVYTVGDMAKSDGFALFSGLLGAAVLGSIGLVNLYAMKKWGKTGTTILAGKVLNSTGNLGPYGSSFLTGTVFGIGFETASLIAAVSLSAVASATQGIQVSLVLVALFGAGMVAMDTLNSVLIRSAFWKIFQTRAFRYMAYGLSGVAVTVAIAEGIGSFASFTIPEWTGPVLATSVISSSFSYAFVAKRKIQSQRM